MKELATDVIVMDAMHLPSLAELQALAARQQQQIESQQQLLWAKEQRLKLLQAQEAQQRNSNQIASENERLRRLRDRVEAQEAKLRKLRALRGQVEQNKSTNGSLSEDLASIRALFNEKEKELTVAAAKVEELTRQLEDVRHQRVKSQNQFNKGQLLEIDRLKTELLYRQKLNEEHHAAVAEHRQTLSLRYQEMSSVDQRIAQLQERLHRKRLLNQQLASQLNNNKHTSNINLQRNSKLSAGQAWTRGRPVNGPSPVATIEPFQRSQDPNQFQNQAQDDMGLGQRDDLSEFLPNKNDPKYQTLPYNTRFAPISNNNGEMKGGAELQYDETDKDKDANPVQDYRTYDQSEEKENDLQRRLAPGVTGGILRPVSSVAPTSQITAATKVASVSPQTVLIPVLSSKSESQQQTRSEITNLSSKTSHESGTENPSVFIKPALPPKPPMKPMLPPRQSNSSSPEKDSLSSSSADTEIALATRKAELPIKPKPLTLKKHVPSELPKLKPTVIAATTAKKKEEEKCSQDVTDQGVVSAKSELDELERDKKKDGVQSGDSPVSENAPAPLEIPTGSRRSKKGNLKVQDSSGSSLTRIPRRVSFDPLALLLDASLEGELELVKKTAQEVSNPSAANDEGITALHNAICAGHMEIVKFLVEFGCDVNAQDSDGWTPLHCAASCNNLTMVQFLVEAGACIFAATLSDQETAAEKCEEDEEGFDGCSEYLYSIQEKLGILNNGHVYALYDYTAQQPDELSFAEGDELVILRKGDEYEREWWWARRFDQEGYVPRNLLGLYPRLRPVEGGAS